ncbi:hypothetical protein ECHLIB_0039 [Ehrlichia chaffeensis str. Liberty]|uniref:hypothetical protein n=1 Tax=Ehrlichia chaffeensis TaxID=945 RepID=UPI000444ADC1|nr:hypothetical protein [Ehrlichia chaffeensis]AHX06121.1 hypothetical protein ECHLIB_0039 [Ehrlichia chaffeensis str. Liberty]AHX09149.1 hypothetical protein ECHWAK_0037 [Ehrlichia chaffeensis str. Wakulla]
MDIFGNEFDVHVNANGTEYAGKMSIDSNGDFDVNLDLQDGVGTLGHLSGHISQSEDAANYIIEYIFDQCIIYPELPVLHSFNGQIVSPAEEGSIIFDNGDNIQISLHGLQEQPEEAIPAAEVEEAVPAEAAIPAAEVTENQQ